MDINYTPSHNYSLSKNNNKTHDYLNNTENQFENRITNTELRNKFAITFGWEKPIKQKFQSSFGTSFDYSFFNINTSYDNSETDLNEQETLGNSIGSKIYYAFGFYPNTRTSFKVSTSISGIKSWITEKSESLEDLIYISYRYNTNASISANYYFSPKLSINLSYWFFINRDYNTRENSYNLIMNRNSLDFSFLYSIF